MGSVRKVYRVVVSGCDDTTVLDIELTDAEFAAVKRVADAVTAASTYGCEPRMYVTTKEQSNYQTRAEIEAEPC